MRYGAQLCEVTRAWLVVSGKQQADNAAAWAAYYQQQGYYGGQPQAQPQPYQQPQQSPSQPASTPGKFNLRPSRIAQRMCSLHHCSAPHIVQLVRFR